jgi:hypothetical protein
VRAKGVEVTIATGPHDCFPVVKILNRKIIGIKFSRASIILGELAHRNEIFD